MVFHCPVSYDLKAYVPLLSIELRTDFNQFNVELRNHIKENKGLIFCQRRQVFHESGLPKSKIKAGTSIPASTKSKNKIPLYFQFQAFYIDQHFSMSNIGNSMTKLKDYTVFARF